MPKGTDFSSDSGIINSETSDDSSFPGQEDTVPEPLSSIFSRIAIQSDLESMDSGSKTITPKSQPPASDGSLVEKEKEDINILDQEMTKFEQQLEKMSCWIDKVRTEIGLLPATPKTFNEILDTIDHERTEKVKQKFDEIHELAQKR